MKINLILTILFSTIIIAAEPTDNYIPNRAEWLEYKMNQYANKINLKLSEKVQCRLNLKMMLECMSTKKSDNKRQKAVLEKIFTSKFNEISKELKIENKIRLLWLSPF